MAKYICNGHRLDLSMMGVPEPLTTGDVVELDPARAQQLIDSGFPLSPQETHSAVPEKGEGE